MKLGEISGTTVKCGDFLQGLTTDRVACIEALFEPEASELIDWISEKGKSFLSIRY